MDEKDFIVSPDEANAEQEALADAKEAEVRAKVVADLGLTDDDTNKTVIDKIVERELTHKKKLSEAIGQKIKWRDTAKTAKPAPAAQHNDAKPLDVETVRKQTETTVRAELEQRDLEEMDVSDEIKTEIKKIAQIQGVSVRKASQDSYIKHLMDQDKAKQRTTEAAGTRSPKAIPVNGKGLPKFDLSTAEGRKDYDKWKTDRKRSEE